MKTPKIAIVGRPNVGKSALFNRIVGKRQSIVDEAEGITRDRIYGNADFFGFPFELIDTGGIDPRSKADFNEEIKQQAEIAIVEADALIMVVDGTVGITDLDAEIAHILHKTSKPLALAVNKFDTQAKTQDLHPFYSLGIKETFAVSALHNIGIAELLEATLQSFDPKPLEISEPPGIKVTLVGRPNVGKSSLLNKLLGNERLVVSPIPGTTRDAVDVTIEHEQQKYSFIDTAGIRRKGAEPEVVDKFARVRTEEAIKRSDVCLLLTDATEGITHQEKRIANLIEEEGKGCILVINKWDLVKDVQQEKSLRAIRQNIPFLQHCPVIFTSALQGRNINKVFPTVKEVYENAFKRISTHQLNVFLERAMQRNHPPMLGGKRLRIYYMAQVAVAPPRFVLFVNYPDLMTPFYKKYLYNQFREKYAFTGCPLPMFLKGKKGKNPYDPGE